MRTILIVDNEPQEIAMLRDMLEDVRYRFITALTGTRAKEIIKNRRNELAAILIDWTLPDVDGVELLTWMKSQPQLKDVEVVVHSAEFASDNVKKAIDSGAYYFLTKPFDEPQLEAIVGAAVSTFELKRRLMVKVKEVEDVFRLLTTGTFQFQTVYEAELLAVHIASSCGHPDSSMGRAELMMNAVEHGNLSIGYEEKGRLLAQRKLESEWIQMRDAMTESIEKKEPEFYTAAKNGSSRKIKTLIDSGVNVNVRDKHGCTALIYASECGHESAVRTLLNAGADVNTRCGRGRTALHPAARHGFTDIVQLLLDAGIDTHAKTNQGWTALKMAVYGNHLDTVRVLLEFGANTASKDEDAESVFHCAIRFAGRDVIKLIKGDVKVSA